MLIKANECLFVYLRSYNDKSKFSFLQILYSSRNTSYFQTSHFCAKLQYHFLALIFVYTLEKCRGNIIYLRLKKTYSPVGPKFVFDKIKFEVLHYIQHDFVRQLP